MKWCNFRPYRFSKPIRSATSTKSSKTPKRFKIGLDSKKIKKIIELGASPRLSYALIFLSFQKIIK
jgi:hypothetical protein